MMEMYHLKLLNLVLITFCKMPTLEYTLKIKGHFACRSYCAGGGRERAAEAPEEETNRPTSSKQSRASSARNRPK